MFSESRNDTGELIVFECQGNETAISDRIVALGEFADEVVVIQIELTEFNKLFSEIVRKSSRQVVSSDIKVDALAPSQIVRDASGELIRVNVEILNGSNPVFGTSVGLELSGKVSGKLVMRQVKATQLVEISNRR